VVFTTWGLNPKLPKFKPTEGVQYDSAEVFLNAFRAFGFPAAGHFNAWRETKPSMARNLLARSSLRSWSRSSSVIIGAILHLYHAVGWKPYG
jgi:hypothetical protein